MGWPQFLRLLDHDSVAHTAPEGAAPSVARKRQITHHPKVASVLVRLAVASAGGGLPRGPRAPQQVAVSHVTRRWPQARSDLTPAPVSRDGRRLVVAPDLPRESGSSVRGGCEHCPHSDPACASWAVWAGPKPPPHRPGRRALSGTNISKDAGKLLVKGYFQIHRVIPETFSLPPGFLPSSTRCPLFMHSDVHSVVAVANPISPPIPPPHCIRRPNRVQWSPMSNHPVAAIIVIP